MLAGVGTWIAFLRAINLGAQRRFAKEAIVRASAAAGFTGVATHINTGNVRLETSWRSRTRIEWALEQAYLTEAGFVVPTIAFRAAEVARIAATADALGPAARQWVTLLKEEPAPEVAATLEAGGSDDVRVVVDGRAVHVLALTSRAVPRPATPALVRALGVATDRNASVIRAIAEKWC